jgi:methylated-DNA-protein-cysteine methyltransferase related protein
VTPVPPATQDQAVTSGEPGDGVSPTRSREARTRSILARVRAIPEGFVSTYGDVDRAAPRLVGQVLATTTEHVPWQRVVRADGTAPLGEHQLRLLREEQVPMRGSRIDLRSARWPGMDHLPRTTPDDAP